MYQTEHLDSRVTIICWQTWKLPSLVLGKMEKTTFEECPYWSELFYVCYPQNMLVKLVTKSYGNANTPASITLHKLLFFIGNMTTAKH